VSIAPGKNCLLALKDGVALCKMINAIKPGSVKKVNESKMPFMQMENISAYLTACENYGVREVFQTVDLYEERDLGSVVTNILSVARKSGTVIQSTGQNNTVAYEAAEKAYVEPSATAPAFKTASGAGSNTVPLLQAGALKAGEAATKGAFGPGVRDINSHSNTTNISSSGNNTVPLLQQGAMVAGEKAVKGAHGPGMRAEIVKTNNIDYNHK